MSARTLTLWLAALCWSLAPGAAHACRLEVKGQVSAAWRQALARMSLAAEACSVLRLELSAEEALLLFSTRDGRQATRSLAAPSELAPTIDALLVTDALTSAEQASEPPAAKLAVPAVLKMRPADTADRRRDVAGLVALLAGARGGAMQTRVSPLLNVQGLLRIDRWEVGLQLGWEIMQFDAVRGGTQHGKWMALVPALSFARRWPLARSALLLGGRLGIEASIPIEQRYQSPLSMRQNVDDAALGMSSLTFVPRLRNEAWTGIVLGVVFPLRSALRLRAELCADLTFVRWSRGYRELQPDGVLTLALGVEFGRS